MTDTSSSPWLTSTVFTCHRHRRLGCRQPGPCRRRPNTAGKRAARHDRHACRRRRVTDRRHLHHRRPVSPRRTSPRRNHNGTVSPEREHRGGQHTAATADPTTHRTMYSTKYSPSPPRRCMRRAKQGTIRPATSWAPLSRSSTIPASETGPTPRKSRNYCGHFRRRRAISVQKQTPARTSASEASPPPRARLVSHSAPFDGAADRCAQ